MIISHKNRFIFVKGGKVGGTSFETRLTKYCGEDDVITPFGVDPEDATDEQARAEFSGGRGPQNYLPKFLNWSFGDLRRVLSGRPPNQKYWNHMPAEAISRTIGTDIWLSYTKVGIFRNPFDTAVSLYFWSQKSKSTSTSKVKFQDWLMSNAHRLNDNWNMALVNGQLSLDVVIRYENPSPGLSDLVEQTRLPDRFLTDELRYKAKSSHRPKWATVEHLFSDFPEGVKAVTHHCADEIEFLNHAVPGQ